MDKDLIEKYKNEMLREYAKANPNQKAVAAISTDVADKGYGELVVNVTALRGLYPVKGAEVTVFKGQGDNITVIDSDITDPSGKTKHFKLPAPPAVNSGSAGHMGEVSNEYGISVKANGYGERIFLNISVFEGVTSLQRADLVPLSASGSKKAEITDEKTDFNL